MKAEDLSTKIQLEVVNEEIATNWEGQEVEEVRKGQKSQKGQEVKEVRKIYKVQKIQKIQTNIESIESSITELQNEAQNLLEELKGPQTEALRSKIRALMAIFPSEVDNLRRELKIWQEPILAIAELMKQVDISLDVIGKKLSFLLEEAKETEINDTIISIMHDFNEDVCRQYTAFGGCVAAECNVQREVVAETFDDVNSKLEPLFNLGDTILQEKLNSLRTLKDKDARSPEEEEQLSALDSKLSKNDSNRVKLQAALGAWQKEFINQIGVFEDKREENLRKMQNHSDEEMQKSIEKRQMIRP